LRNPSNDKRRRLTISAPAKAGVQERVSTILHGTAAERSAGNSEPERTCILTRAKGSKDELIRLALGPNGQVGPDVRARAPGRGAWVSVGREELDRANAKGKLKGALSRAFKTGEIAVPEDLGAQTEAALRQAALDRLGMEARSGKLINGAERVETAARSGKVYLLIHSADAGEDGRKRMDQAWRAGGSRELGFDRGLVFPEGRTILSMALGRENVVHVALTDPAAAARVSQTLARWRAFTDPGTGLDGGEIASGPSSRHEQTALADESEDEGIE
jgi:predicted RNA-binding protein YlxR (DUF448 family)